MSRKKIGFVQAWKADQVFDDNTIFEIIPRSTANVPQEEPAAERHAYGAANARLDAIRRKAAGRRMTNQELYEAFYEGRKKQSWDAYGKAIERYNEYREAQGYNTGLGSTGQRGEMPLADIPRRPRKAPTT